MAAIPRGIQSISWKNKTDKSIAVRYRVQVKRKAFQVDRLFDTLEDAATFLADTKSPEGRKAIAEGRDRVSSKGMQDAISGFLLDKLGSGRMTLGQAVDAKIARDYTSIIEAEGGTHLDKDVRTAKVNRDRLRKIKSVEIGFVKPGEFVPSGSAAKLKQYAKGYKKVEFGSILLEDMSAETTTAYIRARLDGDNVARSTVKREIGALQAIVNQLPNYDQRAASRLPDKNPFSTYDKSLLRGGKKRRRRVISEEEEGKLLLALRACRNPEMPLVFALGLATGMRRSEILSLRWNQIDLKRGVIELDPDQTKADEERLVILLPEAITAIKRIKRKDERVFHYSIEGFKTNFARVLKRVGLTDLRFHDTRRSFISRVLMDITASPVAIADMIGASSVRSLEESTIRPLRQAEAVEQARRSGRIQAEEVLRASVGHQDSQTSLAYTNLVPDAHRAKKASRSASKDVVSLKSSNTRKARSVPQARVRK